jgi:hypothetical protein
MPWVKIDDATPLHPKVIHAGAEALGVWLACLCYAQRTLSDGFIPAKDLPYLLPGARVRRAMKRLLKERLMEEAPGGYRIHDYSDFQPTRDQVLADRKASKERKHRWQERTKNGVRNAFGARPGTLPRPVPSITTKAFVVSSPDPGPTSFDQDASLKALKAELPALKRILES